MTVQNSQKIFFLRVVDNTAKLQRLCHIVQDVFLSKENLLIIVPSDEVAAYIDQLLWRLPEESFLPHVIANGPIKERVVITTAASNLNQADTLLNLCPTIPANAKDFQTIYELLDLTHPTKEDLSRKRIEAYQAAGSQVIES